MCGEHSRSQQAGSRTPGSSPHVRGTLPSTLWRYTVHGIIPACAGNTYVSIWARKFWRDHPRMCGDHFSFAMPAYERMGSSPHVRGTRVRPASEDLARGIIPACAGNTRGWRACTAGRGDHPRMCGEHCSLVAVCEPDGGSSPHVRGTLFSRGVSVFPDGIIPACAGNTGRI